jgi:hypothetical protein
MDWRDEPYPTHRIVCSKSNPFDGLNYWLSITRAEDGLVQHRWDLTYATEREAFAAASALLQTGTVWMVVINHEVRMMRRSL